MKYTENEFIKHTENIPLYRWQTTIFPTLEKMLKIKNYKNENFLDFGCGSGQLNHILRTIYKINTDGIDISEKMIKASSKNDPKGVYKTVLENGRIPFEDESYACCYSLWVFVEMDSLDEIVHWIKEIYRVLKKDGLLIFVINNFDNLGKEFTRISEMFMLGEANKIYKIGESFTVKLKGNPTKGIPPIHFKNYYWPPKIYQKILEDCGFRNFECKTHANNNFFRNELKKIQRLGIEILDMREAEGLSTIISAQK